MKGESDFFGNPKRIKEYRLIFYCGISLLIIGLLLFTFFKNYLFVYGVAFISIGLMCTMAGFLGLREEYKKYGIKRLETKWGKLSLFIGISSLWLIHFLFSSIIFAIIAIILGKIAIKKGDNTYGKDGMMCGIIVLLVVLYLWILNIYFI